MNKWHARPLNPVSIVLLSYLDKVVREEPALALGARALPLAALHLLHGRDHVARAQAQLVRQLGRVLVESHHLLTSLHLSGADHWVEMSHVYVSLLATGL